MVVRRGTDVLKALAIGARFAFLGRPLIYAAAIGGTEGVCHAMSLLRAEVDRNLAMLSVNSIEEVKETVLASNQSAPQHSY